MIAEKIRNLRKQGGMSQETLANHLNVSRQAVTKWETGAGIPDISNLLALGKMFQVSTDELLGHDLSESSKEDFLYESITEYDLSEKKHFDIKFAWSRSIKLTAYEGEKIKIRLASNKISDIRNAYKIKLDDIRSRLDIDLNHQGDINMTLEKSDLYIFIYLPLQYIGDIEITGSTQKLELDNLQTDQVEFSGKAKQIYIKDSLSHIEIDSNEDMEIRCENLRGRLDINQISSKSKLYLGQEMDFMAQVKGIKNKISYEKDGKIIDGPGAREKGEIKERDLRVELNGIRSELVIVV